MPPKFALSHVDGTSSTAWFVHTNAVNWVLLHDDSGITLIDGGYPRQAGLVQESIRAIGAEPGDIRGALLTHAHVDHIGGLAALTATYGFAVFADPAEVAHAHRDYLQQASPLGIASMAYRARVWRWLAEVVPLGVLSKQGIRSTTAFRTPLDLPGAPVPVATPGHTDGHSAFLVADGTVLVSGDALVSGHPISNTSGCQCIPEVFQHDPAQARRSVEAFAALSATTLFPGHGPRVDGSVAQMARDALTL